MPAHWGSYLQTIKRLDCKTQAESQALQLYGQVCRRSWSDQIGTIWRRRSSYLLDLTSVQQSCQLLGHHYEGEQTVAIHQIRGSDNEGRSRDFDANFRPLQSRHKERWLGIAMAVWRGVKMPPVSLVRVGEVYFVQDGHHRISVARAMGLQEIEAVVTGLQVAGQLPWAEPARLHAGITRLIKKVLLGRPV
jgi:hypothetical protein